MTMGMGYCHASRKAVFCIVEDGLSACCMRYSISRKTVYRLMSHEMFDSVIRHLESF